MENIDLNNLGEFGLIDKIAQEVTLYNKETIKGIGDDAAVLDLGNNFTLVSTDMLLEGVHFDLSYVPLKHLGYKAVAVNVSDIAAMNGIPKQITVSIGISSRFGYEAINALYEGINLACENYKIDLVGGDTSASRTGLTISITVVGEVVKDKIAYRSGAKTNDIVCVTGDLGAAYLGLQILEREKSVFLANPNMQPDLDKNEYVVGRQLRPDGRTDVIHEMNEKGLVPTSMIDISDGLASEILHLSKNSGKGFTIFVDNLPIDNQTLMAANEFNISPITVVMNGGEDYELLMTFSQSDYEKVKSIPEITPIGFVTDEPNNILVLNSGEKSQIVAQGWKHFES
jgi:thiamine-monophosphate kinase